MSEVSRTAKSLKNAKIGLVFYFINLILQFFSRKVFLECLGAELLGLSTTAQNLIGFLNLAELGIGGAIAFTLYKPLYEKNVQVVNEVVSVQGWLYRRVAYCVIIGACILMCFFSLIFEKANVPLWYTYGSFIVLLISALLGYFINYRQIVLTADQKEYMITWNLQGGRAVKVFLQILAIYYLDNGYVYWMILELVVSVAMAVALDKLLKRTYPWLKSIPSKGGKLRKKYPEIIQKTKQVFFHQIAGVVLTQTSPLIIYAYASLTLVAIYGNYMLIILGVISLMNSLFNGINASVGNLVAEGDMERIKSVFWEFTSIKMWFASIICFGIYTLGHSFISLWVGKEFILEETAFQFLVIIAFINLTRTSQVFLSAFGLFQDIWAPLTEAILNLGLSILLGYYYGLTGILFGVLISLLLMVCCWKPVFLFKKGFKTSLNEYIWRYAKYVILILISWLAISLFLDLSSLDIITSYRTFCLIAFNYLSIYVILSLVLFACFDKSFRLSIARMKLLFGNR